MPEITGGIGLLSLVAAAVALAAGVVVHEGLHLAAFRALGVPVEVRFSRQHLGIAVTPQVALAWSQLTVALFAPLLGLLPAGVMAWLLLSAETVSVSVLVAMGVFTIAVLPSPGDVWSAIMYDRERAREQLEVHADG